MFYDRKHTVETWLCFLPQHHTHVTVSISATSEGVLLWKRENYKKCRPQQCIWTETPKNWIWPKMQASVWRWHSLQSLRSKLSVKPLCREINRFYKTQEFLKRGDRKLGGEKVQRWHSNTTHCSKLLNPRKQNKLCLLSSKKEINAVDLCSVFKQIDKVHQANSRIMFSWGQGRPVTWIRWTLPAWWTLSTCWRKCFRCFSLGLPSQVQPKVVWQASLSWVRECWVATTKALTS